MAWYPVTVKDYIYDPDTDEEFELVFDCNVWLGTPAEPEDYEIDSITLREFGRTYYIRDEEAREAGIDLKAVLQAAFDKALNYEPDFEAMLDN